MVFLRRAGALGAATKAKFQSLPITPFFQWPSKTVFLVAHPTPLIFLFSIDIYCLYFLPPWNDDVQGTFNTRSKRSAYARHASQLIAGESMVERVANVLRASFERPFSEWGTFFSVNHFTRSSSNIFYACIKTFGIVERLSACAERLWTSVNEFQRPWNVPKATV